MFQVYILFSLRLCKLMKIYKFVTFILDDRYVRKILSCVYTYKYLKFYWQIILRRDMIIFNFDQEKKIYAFRCLKAKVLEIKL